MSETKSFGKAFQHVDKQDDPVMFFRVLDLQAANPGIQQLRAKSIELCAPKPGATILDVGCGTGEVVRALAALVRPGGKVIGLDVSEQMIGEAQRRTTEETLPVEYRIGNAEALDVPDASFDAVRSERVLQHLKDPDAALAEFVRASRSGGHVVVTDTDWGTATIDHPDLELTKRMNSVLTERFANPWVGRRLRSMFVDAGLQDVTVTPGVLVWTEWDPDALPGSGPPFQITVAEAVQEGTLSEDEGRAWLEALAGRAKSGKFFVSVTMFCVGGRKP